MSVLKWIWGLLRKIWAYIDKFVRFYFGILSSVLAWIIAGIAWLIHQVANWFGEAIYNMFAQIESIQIGQLRVSPLADWIGRDVLALDVAWECIIVAISLWVASRIARLTGSGMRLVIDLL